MGQWWLVEVKVKGRRLKRLARNQMVPAIWSRRDVMTAAFLLNSPSLSPHLLTSPLA